MIFSKKYLFAVLAIFTFSFFFVPISSVLAQEQNHEIVIQSADRIGPGSVVSADAGSGGICGISCGILGQTCSCKLREQTVQLRAIPSSNSIFNGWGGACDGQGLSCSIDAGRSQAYTISVSASFTKKTFPLSVSTSGTGAGKVTSNPAGIDCGSACSKNFDADSTVILTAVPDSSSTVVAWSDASCSNKSSCAVTMDAAKSVTVIFAKSYGFAVNKTGDGSGTVTSAPSGINCGSTCSANFVTDASVTLIAVPSATSSFVSWSGVSCEGGQQGDSSCKVTMNGEKKATAIFTKGRKLTITKNGDGSGTVTSSPEGINCGTTCSTMLLGGNSSVTLTATPSPGSVFTQWGNGALSCGKDVTCSLTLTQDTSAIATFKAVTPCSGLDTGGTSHNGSCSPTTTCASGLTALSGAKGCTNGNACCYTPSNTTSCSGKDSSNVTQSGTCSDSASCSSGVALTGASGCASGMACCYTASTSGKCEGVAGQKCAVDCSKETGYESGGTGTCATDPNKPLMCCKTTEKPGNTKTMCSGLTNEGLIPCGRSCDNPATTDVDESAICTLCHLFLLMKNITSWIFMVMTYIAFTVLVAMGILYIVSSGNTQMTGVAKGGIKAALYGFAIVLLGWVAINVTLMMLADGALGTDTAAFSFKTNGSWFTYSCDAKSKYVRSGISGATSGGTTTSGGGGGTVTCGTGACANDPAVKAAVQNQTSMPANDYMAILQAGEHYGQTGTCSKASSPTGACGVSQTMPNNYKALCGFSSCDEMKADVNKDIACGAKVASGFKNSHNVKCGDDPSKRIDCTIDGLKSLAGCYNRGYHCNISPRNVGGKWYDCGEIQGGKSYCDRVSEYASSCK